MDDAIEFVLKQRNDKLSGNLTSQDLFYVKTTKIHEIFKALVFHNADNGQVDTSSRLIDINSIILVSTYCKASIYFHYSNRILSICRLSWEIF